MRAGKKDLNAIQEFGTAGQTRPSNTRPLGQVQFWTIGALQLEVRDPSTWPLCGASSKCNAGASSKCRGGYQITVVPEQLGASCLNRLSEFPRSECSTLQHSLNHWRSVQVGGPDPLTQNAARLTSWNSRRSHGPEDQAAAPRCPTRVHRRGDRRVPEDDPQGDALRAALGSGRWT